jgi:hypothetical protein
MPKRSWTIDHIAAPVRPWPFAVGSRKLVLSEGGDMRIGIGSVLLALLVSLGIPSNVPANASTLPGGRAYYVVSLARLDPKTPPSDWVRLAFYRFDTSGTVTEGFWFWSSSNRDELGNVLRVCDWNCPMFGAPHFISDGPRQLSGSFAVSGSTLRISWATGQREAWTLVAGTKLQQMSILPSASSYPVTYGRGFGSTRGWSSGADVGQIYDAIQRHGGSWRLAGTQYQWMWQGPSRANSVSSQANFYLSDAKRCTSACMYMDNGTSSQYFATTASVLPRKLMRETFMDSHRDSSHCYQKTAHPHLWSGLEVIDDAGAFRGWVSVETSLWANPALYTDYMSVAWYVG